MKYLDCISRHAADDPNKIAISVSDGRCMSYGQLEDASNRIALFIDRTTAQKGFASTAPVIVHGHKDPLMIACFLGCLKSGHPYVPIDMHSVPRDRALGIMGQVGPSIVFEVENSNDGSLAACIIEAFPSGEGCSSSHEFVDRDKLEHLITTSGEPTISASAVSGDDLAYIIFTSGSTGAPKGVQITADCFDNFCQWALSIGSQRVPRENAVFLNQAPFSFDLSVYELSQALWAGATLHCLTKQAQDDARELIRSFGDSDATIWVSTPSFAELCLANPEFGAELLPRCNLFLFCGEALRNTTASRLQERFPSALIVNTYGPTESTVAVTSVIVTSEMSVSSEPLHCGTPKPGTEIRIAKSIDESTFSIENAEAGELGEIIIVGDTVARGYFQRDDLTRHSFGELLLNGERVRAYRTGDEGFLDEDGNLHCRGRIDLQVKLNGFRIELGEIEEGLVRLPQVKEAEVVLVKKSESSSHLEAHVVSAAPRVQSDFREGLALKEELKKTLPHYMIPKKVVFRDALPMTPNGKIDRKALA